MSMLEVSGLRKVYTNHLGGQLVEALKDVTFTVEKGEYVAIMGESGSGKTTLLNILAALDRPTAGTVRLDGQELSRIRDADAAAFRRDRLGFVFQEFNLLDTFTLEDNIYLPLVLAGRSAGEMRQRLQPVAARLGHDRAAEQISLRGVRRAEAARRRGQSHHHTAVAWCWPTSRRARSIRGRRDELLRLFGDINRAGQTVLMVTHSVKAASTAGRVLFIRDGEVFHQLYRGDSTDEQLYQKIADTLTLLATGGDRQ